MSVQRRGKVWVVRWLEGKRHRARTFDRAKDAQVFDGEIRRRRRLGELASLDRGLESLDEYVTQVWTPTFAGLLSSKTRKTYTSLYDTHISPTLGDVPLREIAPELVGRWQSDRLAAGAGPVAVRRALELLGSILQRAAEGGRIRTNPVRVVRKAKVPKRQEVRPLAPTTVEKMRAASTPRDATLISVLAYAGLRPGEALGLRWSDLGERTIRVRRSISLGAEKATKTSTNRSVRLLSPLARDLAEWRLRCGCPGEGELVFPGHDGEPWSEPAYQSWRRRAFKRVIVAAGIEHARPYDLRHSFASLLIHEGRNVIDVARQLGHSATMTLNVYGHVIDELDDSRQLDAESAIMAARATKVAHQLRTAPTGRVS